MKSTLWAVTAAISLICFAPSSRAVATATVSIGNVRINLIDLDPNDGITPGIIMPYTERNTSATACKGEHIMSPCKSENYDGYVYIDYHSATAWATADTTEIVENIDISSGAYVVGEGITLNGFDEQVDWSRANSFAYLGSIDAFLTPHTELVVKADIDMLVSTTNNPYYFDAWGTRWYISEHASAAAFLRLGSGSGESFALAVEGDADSKSFSNTLEMVTTNSSGASMALEFFLQSNTSADSPFDISAVPEPATYLLMLGGIGVVGFASRRRRYSGR